MEYEQLGAEYQADTLAEALYAREVEFFHYDFDRANFEAMLKTLPAGDFRVMIQSRLAETRAQMGNVEAIYAALKSRITEGHAAAVERVRLRRAEARSGG